MFLSKSTIKLIKPQSFYETRDATLVTIHELINKCCNVYVFHIPQKKYKLFIFIDMVFIRICNKLLIYSQFFRTKSIFFGKLVQA